MTARQLAALAFVASLAVTALAASPAGGQGAPTLKIVGFASTLGDGKNTPRVEVRNNGTIKRCKEKKALSAIFVLGNVASGSRYQQYWSSRGKTVFMGKMSTLTSALGAPRPVYMGFTRAKGLKNGKYIFQFILNGRPYVLGSVTRRC